MPRHEDLRGMSREEREERKARREAKRHGYEYRPSAYRSTDEARRLAEGFRMLEQGEDEAEDVEE